MKSFTQNGVEFFKGDHVSVTGLANDANANYNDTTATIASLDAKVLDRRQAVGPLTASTPSCWIKFDDTSLESKIVAFGNLSKVFNPFT